MDKGSRLYSLENERWMSIRKAADAVMHQTIAAGLQREGIAYRVTDNGVEIAAYSREHILRFSDGYKSVQQALEVNGFRMELASEQQKQVANVTTRGEKRRVAALDEVAHMWHARLQDSGFPLFTPGDERLKAQGDRQAMTAGQAVDAALDQAKATGKRLHSDYAILERAIRASDYATPHASISKEITRRVETSELVQTQQGFLRRDEAVQLARQSQSDALAGPRASLLADVQSSLTELAAQRQAEPHPSSASLPAAKQSGSGVAVELPPASMDTAVARISELARTRGLPVRVVSDSPLGVASTSYAAAVRQAGRLEPGNVLVLVADHATSTPVAVLRDAAAQAGGVVIELRRSLSLQAQSEAAQPQVQRRTQPSGHSSKLEQLAKLKLQPVLASAVQRLTGTASRPLPQQTTKLKQ